jgi:hypothetical protein
MGTFDWFVAELKCPKCGKEHAANSRTNMQTKIDLNRWQNELGIGHHLSINYPITGWCYIEIRAPEDRDTFTLIEAWECSDCPGYQLAVVEIIGSKIVNIEAIEPSRENIEGANYVTDDIDFYGFRNWLKPT